MVSCKNQAKVCMYVAKVLFFKVNLHVSRLSNIFFLLTLTGGNQKVSALCNRTEIQMYDRPSVSATGQRCLTQICHFIGHWKYQQHNIPEFGKRTDFDRRRSL